MTIPFLKNAKDLAGKRIVVRVDINVPISNGEVRDDFRIRRILPTLSYLKEHAARVILLSHHSDAAQTLKPTAGYLNKFIKTAFVRDIFNASLYSEKDIIFLCENLRFYKEEEKNDMAFARKLASLGDIYVNEAFSVSHRAHASIVSLPRLMPHYAGFLFEEEVKHLKVAFHPPKPFLFILGGLKMRTKLLLAEKFLDTADYIFIGGAIVNNIFKTQGYEIGLSVTDETPFNFKYLIENKKVILPRDVIVQKNNGETSVKSPTQVLPDEKMLDVGPKTLALLKDLIQTSAFILWNGPLGKYESGFEKSTIELINALMESRAKTIIGGGDTVAAISNLGKEGHFGFVSTGGGAMLEFLANRTLPGIDALTSAG